MPTLWRIFLHKFTGFFRATPKECSCHLFLTSCLCACPVAQSCPTLCYPMESTRPLCPWGFPCKNIQVGCHFLLQGIFLTQGSNSHLLHLLHGKRDSLQLSHQRSPYTSLLPSKWVRVSFQEWNMLPPEVQGAYQTFHLLNSGRHEMWSFVFYLGGHWSGGEDWNPHSIFLPLFGVNVSSHPPMPIFAHLVYLTLCHWYSGLVWYSVECPDGRLDYILTRNRKVSITLGKTINVRCCLCHVSMNPSWSFWMNWIRTHSASQWPLSHPGGSSSRDIISNTTTALWCCSLARFLIVHCRWPWSTDFLQRPDWLCVSWLITEPSLLHSLCFWL